MLNENNIVAKSKQLIESKFPGWDASTLNVFDTYLSRINPLEPSSSEVIFTKKEYEELIGVKEMRPEQLNKCIRKFMGNTVAIPTERGGWRNYCLFDRVWFDKNDAGEWEVQLRCHPELKHLFFELKESGYQKYKLKYSLNLKYKASKLLYYLLKDNQYRGVWVVEVSELRERLGATDKSYEKFKEFNRTVLQKAEKEINQNTDIKFTYEKVMKGRLTRAVKFIIEQPKESDVPPGQMNVFDYPELVPDSEPADPMKETYDFWSGACDDEFNTSQIKELSLLASSHIDFAFSRDERDRLVYDYLRKKYVSLNAKPQGEIKSRYGYMKFIVENDC